MMDFIVGFLMISPLLLIGGLMLLMLHCMMNHSVGGVSYGHEPDEDCEDCGGTGIIMIDGHHSGRLIPEDCPCTCFVD